MDKKRLLFVYNPRAGKAQIKNHLSDVIDILVKGGYEVTIYPTQGQGDAIHQVMNRNPDYDVVVCSGGDGTFDEVITGMMFSGKVVPIGYVPAGSTNDFATSLRLPKGMINAANAIVTGDPFPCDIGAINQDYFLYVAAFGLFTDVTYETDQQLKNTLGHMAYLLEGMKRLSQIRSYHMKVSTSDLHLEGDFLFGMVTNSVSVGGFKGITGKQIKLDDGVFEVTLIRSPTNPMEVNQILLALADRELDSKLMYSFKTDRVVFECEEEVPWTTDGEFGGNLKVAEIENKNKAITIFVPKA